MRALVGGGVVKVELWCERFGEYLKVLNRAESTIYGYKLETKLFLQFLEVRGVEGVGGITREDVNAYRMHLHQWRKPDGSALAVKTQIVKLSAVLTFLGYLYRERFILSNPGKDVKLPKAPDKLPEELPSVEQVVTLLETPDVETPLGIRDRAMMEVLYSSALRNAELRGLTLEDVDLYRLELRVQCGKGRKGRVVPLGEPAALWVETYLFQSRPSLVRDAGNDVLFLNSLGRPLRRETLTDLVRETSEKAGLPMKVTPHVLRHCCATHMLARKAGLRQLQQLLGHANLGSTQRYTRVEISDLREVFLRCHPRESC